MPGRGRGGRGRGRGRGAGRGGRGGRRGRSSGRTNRSAHLNTLNEDDTKEQIDLDVDKDVNAYFTGDVSVDQHYEGQSKNRDRYAAGLAVKIDNGIEVPQSK